MDDFMVDLNIGLILGVLLGIVIIVGLYIFGKPKVQVTGQYLNYENVLYKKVSEEELDNIIILEVK